MNILANGFHWFERAAEQVAGEHDVVRVGVPEIRRAWERPSPDWYREFVPAGWQPDVALFCCPEYHVMPPYLGELPCPVALWIGDWYMNPNALRQLAPFADLLLADAVGTRALRAAGLANVEECCPWTFDPALHRPDWEAAPLHDVSFVGSFNSRIHVERNRWLERVLRLPDRYRVTVTAGLWDEDYVEFLQRSRLSFNYSATGDVNMRCFEATACGSLLLVERENREISRWLRPGEDCVLYGEDDFEDVVAHYLEHEDERAAIARSGWERVQAHAPQERMPQLVQRLESLADAGGARPARRPGRVEAAKASAFQALNRTVDDKAFAGIEVVLDEAENAQPDDAAVLVNRGVLYLLYAATLTGETRDEFARLGVEYHNRAVQVEPGDATARLNQGRIAEALGAPDAALAIYRNLLAAIDGGGCVARPDRVLCPPVLDWFTMRWQDRSLHAAPSREEELTALVVADAAERLADLTPPGAERLALYRRAVETSGTPGGRRKLAAALGEIGDTDGALSGLAACVAETPMTTDVWELYLAALHARGRRDDAHAFLQDRERMLRRLPTYEGSLERLRATLAAPA
ncbi:MAG: glycosyltransferase [Actinomycetota bacterium]|nr:glycosyltransferase [Actinomycetota bacterium]